jgi:hypothetical protein
VAVVVCGRCMLFVSGGSLFVGAGLSFVGGTRRSWVLLSSVGGGLMFVGGGSLSTSFRASFVVRGCQGEWGSLFKWVVGLGCGRCKSFVGGVIVRGWGAHVAGRRGRHSWVGISWAPLVVCECWWWCVPPRWVPRGMGVRRLESRGGHGTPGAVLYHAPHIPAGMEPFHWNPLESAGMALESTGMDWNPQEWTGIHRNGTGMDRSGTGMD